VGIAFQGKSIRRKLKITTCRRCVRILGCPGRMVVAIHAEAWSKVFCLTSRHEIEPNCPTFTSTTQQLPIAILQKFDPYSITTTFRQRRLFDDQYSDQHWSNALRRCRTDPGRLPRLATRYALRERRLQASDMNASQSFMYISNECLRGSECSVSCTCDRWWLLHPQLSAACPRTYSASAGSACTITIIQSHFPHQDSKLYM
jgi:hypothetical protein